MPPAHPLLLLLAALALAAPAAAQVGCSGTLRGPEVVTSNVDVSGDSCILSEVNVTGSVTVSDGGTLTTRGRTVISGSVRARRSGVVNLGGQLSVLGDVSFADSPSVLILGGDAVVTKVSVSGEAQFLGRGTAGSVSALGAGNIVLQGMEVRGGGVAVEGGNTTLVLCDADVSGGISFSGVSGSLFAVVDEGCAASNITGPVSVEKGSGDVRIIGSKLMAGDLLVVEQEGNVDVRDATVSDINIEDVTGDVELADIVADSDGTIAGTNGSVTLRGIEVSGDFNIERTSGTVGIFESNFNFEDVSISGSTGMVSIVGNTDFSVKAEENAGVNFSDNLARVAEFNKNSVGTTVENNRLDTLPCSDNDPAPTGGRNVIGGIASGQCAML